VKTTVRPPEAYCKSCVEAGLYQDTNCNLPFRDLADGRYRLNEKECAQYGKIALDEKFLSAKPSPGQTP
jgi:hypothetical protein